jgi:hypothetical protein
MIYPDQNQRRSTQLAGDRDAVAVQDKTIERAWKLSRCGFQRPPAHHLL